MSSSTYDYCSDLGLHVANFLNDFRYGTQPPPEPIGSPIALSANEVGHSHHHHHHESFSSTRSGQILWIRGLTRLQTQVGQRISQLIPAFFHFFFHIFSLFQQQVCFLINHDIISELKIILGCSFISFSYSRLYVSPTYYIFISYRRQVYTKIPFSYLNVYVTVG